MIRSKVLKLLVIVFMFLLVVNFANALGVTPAKRILDIEQDASLNYEENFIVVNDVEDKLDFVVEVKGELADYVSLDKKKFKFKKGEREKNVSYKISLPENIVKPGNNDIVFIVAEDVENKEKGSVVGASLSVMTVLRVRVPYEGKYVEPEFIISKGDSDGIISFIVYAHNLGEEDIKSAKAFIEVSGSQIGETNEEKILSGERKELIANWNVHVDPGEYSAKAVIVYDKKEIKINKDFEVGETKFELQNVVVSDFKLGDVAKFEILLNNLWNEDIEDVYARMEIYNLNGVLIDSLKTPLSNFNVNDVGALVGYWDTSNVEVGSYMTKLVVYYPGGSFEKVIDTKIDAEGIKTKLTNAIITKNSEYNFNYIFISALVLLVVLNIFWFMHFGRKKHR
jgi:hypothetical protein